MKPDMLPRIAAALADRYRVERELGHGGMATVYLAHDLKHERRVAIKVLKPELAAAMGAERFLREIKTIASLQHPHILPLFDSGMAEVAGHKSQVEGLATGDLRLTPQTGPATYLFYVMPFVDGESLRARLDREAQLPIAEAVKIASQVAGALSYAHRHGVIHRDIKPDNILLHEGEALLADFGIALAMSEADRGRLTGQGISLGTPQYMSPEQAAGDREVDPRSDIYSLGAVTYEMLAGEPSVTGSSTRAMIAKVMTVQSTALRVLRDSVPVELEAAVTRSLAKAPVDRFGTAREFADALSAQTPPAHTPASPVQARRPNRLPLGAGGLVLVVAAAIGGYALFGRASAPKFDRIAVLPMDNQTGDTSQTFFADGMTREVIGVLTDAGVRVLGHRAVLAYRGSTRPASEIAKDLGVDAIVTGSVLKSGDEVQIAADLIDPRTGDNLWSRTFSRPATDVVSLQHDMAGEIARGIRARLTADQTRLLEASRPVNPKAYALYLLGAEAVNVRTQDGFRRASEFLNRSLALDSTFAPAWSWLAIANAYAVIYQTTPRDSGRAIIERAARRAIALDDRAGDPYFALGAARAHVDWDFPGAAEQFRLGRARTLSTQAQALYGWIVWEIGQDDRNIRVTERLVDQEPTTAQWRSDLAWGYWSNGDTAKAHASALRATQVDSTFYEAWDILSLIEADRGDLAAATRAHQRAIVTAGGDYWVRQFNDGLIADRKGDLATIRRVLKELDGDPRLAQRAGLLHLLGERDAMYAMFNRAVDERDPDLFQVLMAMPRMYDLKGEPRHQQLLTRMGLVGAPKL